jgi:hypothetical protein
MAMLNAMEVSTAAALRDRGTPRSRASSVWATSAHTEPGTYLPSWLRKNTRATTRADSGLPRSASRAR